LAADDLFSKALALDPNNPDTLARYMILLSVVDRRMEALAMALQLRALEPYVPSFSWQVAEMQWENGQDAAAIEILRSLPDQPPARVSLAMIYASQGRYKEAADSLAAVSGTGRPAPPRVEDRLRAAEALLRTAPTKTASPQSLPGDLAVMGFAYLYVGAPERVLEHYESTLESGVVGGQGGDIGFLWHLSFAPVRKLERFKTFVSKTGLVEYWRAKGWPEFCRPTTGDDFVCD
jgi:tetratricopeptide (TPR) repeat protein